MVSSPEQRGRGLAIRAVLEAAVGEVIHDREVPGSRPTAPGLDVDRAELHLRPTHQAPVLPPRVPQVPILAVLRVGAPTRHGDDVVGHLARLRHDPAGVIYEGLRVYCAGDGAPVVDLRHHRLRALDAAVVRNRRVREGVQPRAGPTVRREGVARAGVVHVRALQLPLLDHRAADAGLGARAGRVPGHRRARHVGLPRLVRDARARRDLPGELVNELVHGVGGAAPARPRALQVEG
mmetsp:Transcript_2896/g.8719  ORF Transcript_2896/g.8719 Transcript_2896/m.8719 type:complete len:236 (-) Transcript_2896:402-1109(-)